MRSVLRPYTVGVKKSSSESLGDKKKFWKHEVYVALPAGDYVANMFTYAGPSSTATPNGIHFVCARVVIESVETVTGPPALLQLYAVWHVLIFSEENKERDSANVVYKSLLL